jgi:predicted phosphodiesterase
MSPQFKTKTIRITIGLVMLVMVFSFLGIALPGMASAAAASTTSFTVNPNSAATADNIVLPDQITLSWTEDPQTTQTIAWRSVSDAGQNQVQYLPAADFNGSFAGAQEATAAEASLYDGYLRLEVTLRGLTPDTGYVYRVGGEGAWSEPATFVTAGTNNDFSFLYMGDVQEGYSYWGEMLKNVVADNPGLKFMLMGGDLVNDSDSHNWQQFFAAAEPVFSQLPLMPAVGNHDDNKLFWDTFALPRNGPAGYEEKFYSFDYGNCHIAVLNSNLMGVPGFGDNDRIMAWLRDDLANSKQRWKFVVLHHPPYPVYPDWRAANLQENWVPIFEEGGVDVVFVGHQHEYMRTLPLRDGQVQADGNGIVYVMGNAGTKHYAPGPGYDYIAKEIAYVSNYQVVYINENTFSLTAKDADGQVIDGFVLTKQPVSDRAIYTITPEADDTYQIGTTPDGINTMTVNICVSGIKYFGVQVTSVKEHDGLEAVAFTHLRDGVQLSLNVTKADFDIAQSAQAGFNVHPGDVVRVYIIDDLNNDVNFNPTILE